MRNEQIITKGVYGFSQISDFISVKDYIFMNSEDKFCLAVRFSNETEYAFDSMTFSIIQLDANGKVLGKTRVEYTDMDFMPGSTYAADRGIVVDSKCVDFKIQFYEAYSSYYRYLVRNRRVIVYYDRKKAERFITQQNKTQAAPSLTVKKKEYGKARLSAFIAFLALLIAAGFNIYYMYSQYADTFPDGVVPPMQIAPVASLTEESMCFGVEYAEI